MLELDKSGHESLTEAQRKRDESVVAEIKANYIAPIVSELEWRIPGYLSLDELERFKAIMRLNERHAPKGEYLLLEFGLTNIETPIGRTAIEMSGAVFTGFGWATEDRPTNPDCPKTFMPEFTFSGYGYDRHDYGIGSVVAFLESYREEAFDEDGNINEFREGDDVTDDLQTLSRFPLPFRIALIANLIQQNVICTREAACRFAAGWDEEIQLSRFFINPIMTGSDRSTCYGWNITIRDVKPGNDLMMDIARLLRNAVAEDLASAKQASEALSEFLGFSFKLDGSRFSEQELQRKPRKPAREPRQSTQKLEDFLFRSLPSKGMHIGRRGKGKSISWSKAHMLFMEEYDSETYSTMESFQSRCYALLKANRRKVD